MKHLKKFNKFKLFLLTLAFILSPHLLSAQNQSLGNITTAGTDCSVATRCVVYVNQPQYGGASISVTGTFVGTLQFEGTGNGAGDNWSSYYTALAVTPY